MEAREIPSGGVGQNGSPRSPERVGCPSSGDLPTLAVMNLARRRTHESPATIRRLGFPSGGGGSRTRVRKQFHRSLYVRRALFHSLSDSARTPPARSYPPECLISLGAAPRETSLNC